MWSLRPPTPTKRANAPSAARRLVTGATLLTLVPLRALWRLRARRTSGSTTPSSTIAVTRMRCWSAKRPGTSAGCAAAFCDSSLPATGASISVCLRYRHALPKPPEHVRLMLNYATPWCEIPDDPIERHFSEYPDESLEEWHRRHGLLDERSTG